VPVPEAELAEFAGQWQLTEMLFGFLPDLPDAGPGMDADADPATAPAPDTDDTQH
jgi:hypothetical protein